jgi:AcrR family transcriptional regulator
VAEVRDQILDAAVEAAAIHGITRLSVADVAKRAGMSRPTVYKHFESKSVLVGAAVQREATTMVAAVVDALAGIDDPRAALEAGLRNGLRLVREHPLLDRIVRTEPEVLVPLLTTDDSLVLAAVRRPIERITAAKFPLLEPLATRRLADVIARLLVSYALSAPDDPPDVVAAMVADLLIRGAASLIAVPPLDDEEPAR